ncbi:MAG: PHP domain-containing protein [Patescibacteria group bacterium]
MTIHKNMMNLEIAELLVAVAASYQLKGKAKNRFRIIAYQRAAHAVEHLSSEAKDLWDEGKLEGVSGIGSSIAGHLDEIFKTGKSKHFEKVMKGLPPAMFDLMKVPGIGAKTAYKLSTKFKSKISASDPIGSLEKLAKAGKISDLEGMGEDSQDSILKSIKEVKGRARRLLLPYASQIADEIINWLKKNKHVKKADALGSLRRRVSTVGDVDVAAATKKPDAVIAHFTKYPKATRTLEKGDRTASIILPGGTQVDLMVESPDAYGALLQHFTGSKHHNIALREHALEKGMSLSEYGIKILDRKKATLRTQKRQRVLKKFSDEESFYKFLGMDWIPPELREGTGEIKAALAHKVPNLVELKDIKADLQIHSSYDIETSHDLGESSMEELVKKADSLGYEYIAFTEHNPSQSGHNNNQIRDILKRKRSKVDQINESLVKRGSRSRESSARQVKKVFNSLEIDILPSGKLPVPGDGLELLDFALVSIHSSFRQERNEMTRRVLAGLSHPKVKIFAHPTARKLNRREGIELNWEEIFEFCIKHGKWLEINAEPTRLDLPAVIVRDAVKEGVKLTLGTDAHYIDGLNNMAYGVSVARRGWAERKDIVNSRSLKEFEKLLQSHD